MKKAFIWIIAIALTALLAVDGTMAYLADDGNDTNVMALGNVQIDQLEYERTDPQTQGSAAEIRVFHDNKPLYPAVTDDGFDWAEKDGSISWEQIGKNSTSGIWDPEKINNEQDKMVFIKNKGTMDTYVRTVFGFEAGSYTWADFQKLLHLNINEENWTWEWVQTPVTIGETTYFLATATYQDVLKPGMLTEPSLLQVALDSAADNEDILDFGETYKILAYSQGVQAEGFSDPETALNESFRPVSATDFPFGDDNAVTGTDLRTALHTLENDTVITGQVTRVIFAETSEYPEIADTYKGRLIDVEQDSPVYAYYVPDESNYDVYILSDGTIYAPANSAELLKNMTALHTIEDDNLDLSRVWNMNSFFYKCTSLTYLDVTGWDVSNVTQMDRTFYSCEAVTTIDGLETWDMGNVTTTFGMFYRCFKLEALDGIGSWNTENVTTMAHMFRYCCSLQTLEIGDWNTGKVQAFNSMFSGDANNPMNLTAIHTENWDVSSATNMNWMFFWCHKLETLDCSNWDVSNVQSMDTMFTYCYELKTIYASEKWNVDKVTAYNGLFNDCKKLVGGNGTVYTGSDIKYACIDTEETPGYLTYKAPNT